MILADKLAFANELRRNPTKAEVFAVKVIKELQSNPRYSLLGPVKFQEVVFGYIPDFYFPDHNLALEIDGSVHETDWQRQYDKTKTANLNAHGVHVERITNTELFRDGSLAIEKAVGFYCGVTPCEQRAERVTTTPRKGRRKRKKKNARRAYVKVNGSRWIDQSDWYKTSLFIKKYLTPSFKEP